MKLRAPLVFIALVGCAFASVPAIAADDSTLYVSIEAGTIPATTYPLASFVQTDDRSFNVVMPLNTESVQLLNVTGQQLIPENLVFNGHLSSPVGQMTTRYVLSNCVMKSASSGSDGNAHFAFTCQRVQIAAIPVATPSPAPTPTPMLKLGEPLAHPAVKK